MMGLMVGGAWWVAALGPVSPWRRGRASLAILHLVPAQLAPQGARPDAHSAAPLELTPSAIRPAWTWPARVRPTARSTEWQWRYGPAIRPTTGRPD